MVFIDFYIIKLHFPFYNTKLADSNNFLFGNYFKYKFDIFSKISYFYE